MSMMEIIKNKEEVKSVMNIIQALADGKTIQAIDPYEDEWVDQTGLNFKALFESPYRIKPEPKHRPFKDRQECWQEMQKHQPFGWIADIDSCRYILAVGEGSVVFKSFNSSDFCKSFDEVMDTYTFADGTTFGVKIEEE